MRRFRIKLTTLLPFVMAALLGVCLFWVSQNVQQLERERRDMSALLASEEEGLRVLTAEWDYLNRPDRIEALAKKYLDGMESVRPDDLLMDARAVPEPSLLREEDTVPILVSTHGEIDEGKKEESYAVPAPRPIDDKSPDGFANDLNQNTDKGNGGAP